MSTPVANTKPLTDGAPQIGTYNVSQDDVNALFEAAGRGDINVVIKLIQKFGLGWYTYDITRLTELSKWYGPLEANGDALINLLLSHKGGKLEINEHMRRFLTEAKAQMQAAGKAIPANINDSINKLLLGQDLSEEEAKNLHTWCLGAKPLVIPSDFRADTISAQLKTLQQKYEEELIRAGRMADKFSPR